MKKSIKIMGIAAMVLLLAVSCKKENKNGFNGETKFMTFSAGISQGDGKTYLDGLNLLWSDGDRIKINNNAPFTLTNGAGSSKGEFEGEAEVAETYYAVYPATGTIDNGTATITLPAEQPYVAGSFDNDIAPMVAKTDDSKAFTFTNVCGLLRLNMTSIAQPFKKIVLKSAKADESLAGEGSVTISGDESDKFVITNGTGNKITVTSDENIASGAKIVFVLPAGTLTTGFNAYFYANADDATPFDNISGSGDWEIEAGKMNNVTVSHEVKVQDAIIQQDAVTASSVKIPYVIQEECVKATIECATDDAFEHVVGREVVVGGAKADPYKTGDVTFTGLSAATPYYVRILVQSEPDGEEKSYCTIVAETLGGDEPIVDEHQFVDLGLPSGLLWATCNVGAEKPEDNGDYFQWGSASNVTSTSIELEESTCPYTVQGVIGDAIFTKYVPEEKAADYGYQGFYDNITTLEAVDDAATQIWRNGWRMPTADEWKELYENCDWEWYDNYGDTGKAGCIIMNKSNESKFIFLPAAGYRCDDVLSSVNEILSYWSSSLDTKRPSRADKMSVQKASIVTIVNGATGRYYGLTVRPVRTATK